MHLRLKKAIVVLLCGAMGCSTFVGCQQTPAVAKIAYLSKGNKPLDHYRDVVTEIAYPTERTSRRPNADFARPPRLIFDPSEDEYWDMTLAEAVRLALENGAIIKDDGSFGSPGNPLFANPNGVRTAYDIGIIESGILFGNRGVEAALADFDAQLTTTGTWGRTEQIQNNANLSLGAGSIFVTETAQFQTQLQKQLANSGTFSLSHNVNYDGNNILAGIDPLTGLPRSRAFASSYNGSLQATYQQPLLAGAGSEFTRIAGPIGGNLTGVSGVSQGVVISRINTDIALADFQGSVASMVRDVENRYWDLHLFYKIFHAESVAAAKALSYYDNLRDRLDATAEQIAQSLTTYHESIARVQNSLADINDNESRLRRLLGLPPRGDSIIRPIDKPTTAMFLPDWQNTVAEALARRPEIRSQRWNVRSLELQLKAAKNLVRPRLDFVSQYQVNGFGDRLFGDGDAPGGGFINDSFYESFANNLTSSWSLGFQLAFPLGLRTAQTQVRNYEFRVRKARAVLAAQEMEVTHELHSAVKGVDRWQVSIASNRERVAAARRTLEEATIALKDKATEGVDGTNTLNRVLQAHIRLREAQVGYYQSLIEYNKSLVELSFRKGSVLEENRVHMSESVWCPSAYDDALRRAWARTYAKDTKLKSSEPIEITQPNPRTVPLSAPVPRQVPDMATTGLPEPAKEEDDSDLDELDDLDDEDGPGLPDPDDDDDGGGEMVGRPVRQTGFLKPIQRAVRPVQQRIQQQRIQHRPVQQRMQPRQVPVQRPSISGQLEQLERTARRTGASKG